MAEVAIGVVAFVGQCYSGTVKAFLAFQRGLDFPETAGKLVLQLEVERIRLQLWGRNSGAENNELYPGLSPYETLITDILKKVRGLIDDSDRLKTDYGMLEVMAVVEQKQEMEAQQNRKEDGSANMAISPSNVSSGRQTIEKVKFILNDVFTQNFTTEGKRQKKLRQQQKRASTLPTNIPLQPPIDTTPFVKAAYNRVRWAIVSQERFEALIHDLRTFVNGLNDLLRDSQQAALYQDWRFMELQAITDINEPEALQAIEEAMKGDGNCSAMYNMARRKSLVLMKQGHAAQDGLKQSGSERTIRILSRDDFEIPDGSSKSSRFITVYDPLENKQGDVERNTLVLVEKKSYDASISAEDKGRLVFRLYRLIELLNTPSADEGNSAGFLPCLGYWSEPEANCWYLVYRYPIGQLSVSPSSRNPLILSQPISLLHYLSIDAFKPSLESRLNLAYKVASTFSELYGSKWLHKGVRSENILFMVSTLDSFDISKPVIAGFEYSRQYTEQTSIDNTPFNIAHAIYRHPRYQGLAAKGYRMAYDVYSLGLVLAEIAWWSSLFKLFVQPPQKIPRAPQTPFVSPNDSATKLAQRFGSEEATDLRKNVLKKARKELAFRVGSEYQGAVEWCLNSGDFLDRSDDELVVEFYEHVVVPLQNVATAWSM